jgi:very-short-patch-repair endonuclease
MRGQVDKHPLDRRIAALAARQHGVVSHPQLRGFGLSQAAIDRRVRAGRLHRVHRGVCAVGHPRLTRNGSFLAAVFSCGEGAVLSHGSAALLWRLPYRETARIDVTVRGSGERARRRLVIVHRAPLETTEATQIEGIPVTSPARTIVDLADMLPERALERALDEADFLGLDLTELAPKHGRLGCGRLRRMLATHRPGSTLTRSALEERFLELCRRHGLPQPEVNVEVEGYEVDFVWRDKRVIVETDGHAAHRTRRAFEHDRAKDAHLIAWNWRPVRVTHRRMESEEAAVAAQLHRLLNEP